MSDPTDPTLISRFGSVLDKSDAVRGWDVTTGFGAYLDQYWDIFEYLTAPGNAHYVQPSPDGDHVYVGAETVPKDVGVPDPGVDDYGGITVYDTSDLANPTEVTRIDPPVIDDDTGKLFTSHNFDVSSNRLYTSCTTAASTSTTSPIPRIRSGGPATTRTATRSGRPFAPGRSRSAASTGASPTPLAGSPSCATTGVRSAHPPSTEVPRRTTPR
ncbi:hypothetical protein BRC81_13125 [Halobacteriales archaeon QS_1_68_20]|nr:MAG: hypothetical protein BRC81_13125 [Halobacteriales archaeon QS_1_68_20]